MSAVTGARSQAGNTAGDPGSHGRHREPGRRRSPSLGRGVPGTKGVSAQPNIKCHPRSTARRSPDVCYLRKAHSVAKINKMRLTPIPPSLLCVPREIAGHGALCDSELRNHMHREAPPQGFASGLSPVSRQLPDSQAELFNMCKPIPISNMAWVSGAGQKARQVWSRHYLIWPRSLIWGVVQ